MPGYPYYLFQPQKGGGNYQDEKDTKDSLAKRFNSTGTNYAALALKICYNQTVKRKKPLSETNPYLKSAQSRKKLIERSIVTSCAVEGIKLDLSKPSRLSELKNKKKINQDLTDVF